MFDQPQYQQTRWSWEWSGWGRLWGLAREMIAGLLSAARWMELGILSLWASRYARHWRIECSLQQLCYIRTCAGSREAAGPHGKKWSSAGSFHFNIWIKLFAKAEEGDQLLNILQEMETAGTEPDLSTYNSPVSSYISLGELDLAERLVQSMQQGSQHPEPSKVGLANRFRPSHSIWRRPCD